MMRSVLSGPFRAALGDAKPSETPWKCLICSSWNHDDHAYLCVLCKRSRLPEWLHVKIQAFQIGIGTQVILPGDPIDVVGVVTEVDFAKRMIVLLAVKDNTKSASRALASLEFSEMSFNSDQVQELRLMEDQNDRDFLNSLSICGDCRRVFHVLSCGQPSDDAKLAFASLQTQVTALLAHKQQLIRTKKYDAVLTCTSSIKELQAQIQLTKRTLEYSTVVLCPYCGWCAS